MQVLWTNPVPGSRNKKGATTISLNVDGAPATVLLYATDRCARASLRLRMLRVRVVAAPARRAYLSWSAQLAMQFVLAQIKAWLLFDGRKIMDITTNPVGFVVPDGLPVVSSLFP